eukprot:TRINITY_DN13058_c0_g1_i1.p1 TRINITY_DN13058_c0_g1~~TRINITY_DN13058_c0_g1_i1.p1  ORF type:complete len:617 (+),score=88.99 TRINITY_DN13058_c0_g1_i1:171-2021(+)
MADSALAMASSDVKTALVQEKPLAVAANNKQVSSASSSPPHKRSEEVPLMFVTPPPSVLFCELHNSLLSNPVIAKCGHTFCRSCIVGHITKDGCCPLDKTPLKERGLIVNRALATQIDELLVRCRYGLKKEVDPSGGHKWVTDPNGCTATVKLSGREEHEKKCGFGPAACPQCHCLTSGPGLEHHLEHECNKLPCPYRAYGCTFAGNKAALEGHLKTGKGKKKECSFAPLKSFLHKYEDKMNRIREQLSERENENNLLHLKLQELQNRLDSQMETYEAKVIARQDAAIRQLSSALEETQKQVDRLMSELDRTRGIRESHYEMIAPHHGTIIRSSDLSCTGTFQGHTGPIWCLAILDGGLLISGSSDTTLKTWDLNTFKCRSTFYGHQDIVHAVVVVGRTVISGSADRNIKVWNMDTLQCIRTIPDHNNTVCALLSAKGYVFSGSYTEIKVWNPESFRCVQTLRGHNHWVRAITAHPNENLLYSGAYNSIKIWDLTSFQCIRSITAHCGSVYSLTVHGNRVFCGTYENSINMHDVDTLECVGTISGHTGAVYSICIFNGRLVSGSYDTTIKVWNLETLKCMQTLNRHTSSVEALVSVNGPEGCIFTGSADHTIKVWR